MTTGDLVIQRKLEESVPVVGVWREVFSQVLMISIVAVVLAAIFAAFLGATVPVYAACFKWTYPGLTLLTLVLFRQRLMDWFDQVWRRNITHYCLLAEKTKDGVKRTILHSTELGIVLRGIIWTASESPKYLLVHLNGRKTWYGAWKVSFAGLEGNDPELWLTRKRDRIKVSPEWLIRNYDHSASISTVVSKMEKLECDLEQEQKWRYQGEERQTELRMKLDTASKELKKLRDRLTASHYLHLQVLAQLKDTSRLGKSKEGAVIRSTLQKSLKQLVEEGDEMYPAIKLESDKPVEPPARAS